MIRRTRIARREFAEERRESIVGIWETEEEFEAEWRKENGEDSESEDDGAEKKGRGCGRR